MWQALLKKIKQESQECLGKAEKGGDSNSEPEDQKRGTFDERIDAVESSRGELGKAF